MRCRRRVKSLNCVVLPLLFIIIYVSETTTKTDLSEELAIKSELCGVTVVIYYYLCVGNNNKN